MDALAGPALALAALVAAAALLRWLGLRLLHRYAPVWLVGPNGFLIDTTGRLGLLQMHEDPRHGPPDGDGGGPGGGGCSHG